MKFSSVFLLFILFTCPVLTQTANDITQKNKDRENILKSRIKSKSIIEYHYVKGDETALADSGYKSFYYAFDEQGRITDYTKYHVFSDLTVKELYQYGRNDKITVNTRYNSRNDRIETITYKYNKKGQLKSQQHDAYLNTVRAGVYFTIVANINESSLFLDVQKDLEIDMPFESYTIIVNITDPEELNQYIVIGDESDPTSPRYSWSQLSMESQRGLLEYTGPNKKEHEYISKFLSSVVYKHDSRGNMTGREVYNTNGDMLEKESYRYDAENRRTGYTKYNDKGRAGSGEAYTYNTSGLLLESMGIEPDGRGSGRLVYKYDELNNLAEKTWYNSSGEVSGKFTYTFNADNRLIEETRYRGENDREFSLKYYYNELGDISEIVRYDINNHKEKLYRYVYEYY
jgi:hypothetical protein